jgi:hypothetical protein
MFPPESEFRGVARIFARLRAATRRATLTGLISVDIDFVDLLLIPCRDGDMITAILFGVGWVVLGAKAVQSCEV